MNEVRNGEQKEQKFLYFEIFYGGQKLHKYFRSLLIKYVSSFEIFYGGQKLHEYFRSLLIKYVFVVSTSAYCVTTGNLNARTNPSSY